MKKGFLVNYMTGMTDFKHGESLLVIFRYMVPEFITALLLYSFPLLIDAFFISNLQSTPAYAALGVSNNLLNLLIKMAEAFGVGTIVLSGQHNGHHDYSTVGRGLRDACWITAILGFVVSGFLYFAAYYIYVWYNVAPEIAIMGVPFLRLRAVSVFFMFIYFAFVGFLRGIKNTQTPMLIFVAGVLIFIFFDYALIFGHFGFPAMGLQGSAVATIIQYSSMLFFSLVYVLTNKDLHKYAIDLLAPIKDGALAKQLLSLSWPIIFDKATMAFAYIWLCKMIGSMGTNCTATFCMVKDIERFMIFPAIAGAQVITLLVSNDFGSSNWKAIKSNIVKVLFLSTTMVMFILFAIMAFSDRVVQFFDKSGDFTYLATAVFPLLGGLVFFDLLQLILSGALRGAGDVRTVMMVRFLVCFLYFIPSSFLASQLLIDNEILKFVLIYGSFFIGNALMSIFYIVRFNGHRWKKYSI